MEAQRAKTAVLNDLMVYQEFDAIQSQKQIKYKQKPQQSHQSTCKYYRYRHLHQRCPVYGKRCMACNKLNHFRAVCRSRRHKEVLKVQQETDEYTEEDRQIDMVNIDFINSNVKAQALYQN